MNIDLLDGPQARRLQAAVERTLAGDTWAERDLINQLALAELLADTTDDERKVRTW